MAIRLSSSVCSSKCRRGKEKKEDREGQVEVEEEKSRTQREAHMNMDDK